MKKRERVNRTICAALQNAVNKNFCAIYFHSFYIYTQNLLFIHSHMHVSVEAVEAYEKCACEFPAQSYRRRRISRGDTINEKEKNYFRHFSGRRLTIFKLKLRFSSSSSFFFIIIIFRVVDENKHKKKMRKTRMCRLCWLSSSAERKSLIFSSA